VIGNGREIGERDGIRLDTVNKLCQSVSNPADETAEGFFDEVPGMLEAFGGDAKRSHLLTCTTEDGVSPPQSGTIHF
jgi:hypothetical protein